MDIFLYTALALLAALAICDLYVGVSNDAVNFLNSAVGSRAAPFWIIMTVASAGVLFGATFSSGLMEVAKTGVFMPEMLTFDEILVICVAVMVTDVLLLNTFNSFGLPTSTTVSIIFELLGGAVAMACYKVWVNGAPLTELGMYINSGKALVMIMAILISVIIAFFSGLVVQYVLRVVFSFKYQNVYRWLGGVFGGAAITSILYFLVMKGAKGASFMQPEWIAWINDNTSMIILTSFAATSVFFQVLITALRVNIFPIIILSGTFALAFAFAGNDLVNFIGVPLAALDSYHIIEAAGVEDTSTYLMGELRNVTVTPTIYLALSGLVMVLTLWFSKKAHRVIRTSINLSSTARGGKEQFGSSLPARVMVRGALRFNDVVHQILPSSIFDALGTRFEKPKLKKGEVELPFDEVRASVNLVLAAALIASATSLKLPLSTTYVTFMVAMGSSLADGAWDRESAVYRISGVLTVISGWFLTAFTAFISCAAACTLFIFWGEAAMIIGMLLALFVIIRSNFFTKDTEEHQVVQSQLDRGDKDSIRRLLTNSVDQYLDRTLNLFSKGLKSFLNEDSGSLKTLKGEAVSLFDEVMVRRGEYYEMALEGGNDPAKDSKQDRDARNFYYRAFTSMKEVSHSLRDQLGVAENYVLNCHSPFKGRMRDNTEMLAADLDRLRREFSPERCAKILRFIEDAQRDFMVQIGEEQISLRKSELYLGYLLCAREALNRYMMVKLLQSELEGEEKDKA